MPPLGTTQLRIDWENWKNSAGDNVRERVGSLPLSEMPPAPFVRGSDTSEAAAKSIEPVRGEMSRKILDNIRGWFSDTGATCDEMEQLTGFSHQTCSARFRDLAKAGAIRDSGKRRKTRSGRSAAVWVIDSKG